MELKDRIKSATPTWFKKIRKAGLIISAVAVALITASSTMPGFMLPEMLNTVCQWIAVGSITASAVSTTAKVD